MLQRRGDFQARAHQLAQRLAAHANWETMLTRPTWAVLMAETGMARSTLASYLAWLREVGLLGLVAHGTTPDLSPAILADPANPGGNEAAVYVLIAPRALRLVAVPRPDDVGAEHVHDGRDWPTDPHTGAPLDDALVDLATGEILDPHDPDTAAGPASQAAWTATPPATPPAGQEDIHQPRPPRPVDRTWTPTPSEGEISPRTRARLLDPRGAGLRPALPTPSPMSQAPNGQAPDAPPWPLGATPPGEKGHRLDRLAAATALQAALPLLRRISTAHVAHLCREWWLAGWTPADILTALGRRPEGTPWTFTHDVRHVPGWFRHRMTAWRAPAAPPAPDAAPGGPAGQAPPVGPPVRPPSARDAAAAAHHRALARARSDRLAAEQALVAGADQATVRALADAARAAHRAAYTGRPHHES
jgi:hypothetical protein